jgi:hypothetical protein
MRKRNNMMNRRARLMGTASYGSMRRVMKDPEGDHGSNQQQNNDGNAGDSNGTGGTGENNNGQEFNPEGFWEDPQEQASQNGTPTPTPAPNQQDDPGKTLGTQLNEGLQALKFDDLFTTDIADQIANGDLKGANERFQTLAREAVKQSVVMNTQVVKAFGQQIMSRVEAMIAEKFGGEKNDAALVAAFPSAKDPAVYKTVKGIFDQSMKHTNGNRDKAVEMTRGMLKFVTTKSSADLGLDTEPPAGRGDTMTDNSRQLVESLLSL